MIAAIFERGRFNAYDTEQTAVALSCYAIGLVGYSVLKVLSPAFYALNDSRTPMYVSLGTILVNYITASVLTTRTSLGHVGLALAVAAVSTFSGIVQFVLMRNRIGGIHGRALGVSLAKIGTAAAAMGILISAITRGLEIYGGRTPWTAWLSVGLSVPLGFGVFYSTCRVLAVPELELATDAFRAPLRRLLGR
jgi:putative peptidoglycan lipid II flippase